MEPAEKIVAFNKMIKAYAEKNHFVYIDYHTAMKDEKNGLRKEYGEDGVHPNKSGYQIMAPIAERGIAEALKQKQ